MCMPTVMVPGRGRPYAASESEATALPPPGRRRTPGPFAVMVAGGPAWGEIFKLQSVGTKA